MPLFDCVRSISLTVSTPFELERRRAFGLTAIPTEAVYYTFRFWHQFRARFFLYLNSDSAERVALAYSAVLCRVQGRKSDGILE